MNAFKSILTSFVSASLLVGGLASGAHAEGFAITDWSARGLGLAGGMVARANDASALAYNPAGITQLPGIHSMAGFTMQTPMSTVESYDSAGLRSNTDVERKYWASPHAYLTYQYNDSLWFGLGLFTRFGMGNGYDTNWPGRYNLIDVSLQTVTLNPNVAWKVNEHFSLAFGVEFMGAMMEMNKAYPNLAGGVDYHQNMDGMGFTAGVNAAMHFRINDQWSAGLTWRSQVKPAVHGKSKWNIQGMPVGALPSGQLVTMHNSDLKGTLSLPESFAFAVAWKPMPTLSFEVGTVYTMWSQYKSLDITLVRPLNMGNADFVSKNPKKWKDTWAFNISAEYQALEWLALRAGYSYETSPMNDKNADYMAPTNGRMRFALGAGFAWDSWTVDVGYSYLIPRDLSYNASAANGTGGVLRGKSHDGNSHGVSVSLGYKF